MAIKVLIADDDPSIVRILSARFSELGMEVQTARNGLQAVLRAMHNPPRMMVLDLHMPELDGFRVCELLFDPRRAPIDIIILTARADLDTLDRCDSLGAYYVAKGLDTWETIKSILTEITEKQSDSLAASKADDPLQTLVDAPRNKVLIVDDDADLAEALASRIRKCGGVTFVAHDGISGYRIALKERPNAIITDYVMADGGGHYMIWRLKSTEATRRTPIIVISGQTRDSKRAAPLQHETVGYGGPVRYFPKPVDVDGLISELSQHCAIHYTPFEAAPRARGRIDDGHVRTALAIAREPDFVSAGMESDQLAGGPILVSRNGRT
jgi:CheY-like chemotaxis protein